MFGKVTPIADNAHPNLIYNQSEIDEYRNMLLVQHTPSWLWDSYQKDFQGAMALPPSRYTGSASNEPYTTNGRAALSYMIEPTQEKADAIRTALLDGMATFPDGNTSKYGGDDWWLTPGWMHGTFPMAWMFDLIQAYHPNTLSASEKTELKEWFRKLARYEPWHYIDASDGVLTREGRTVGDYANWWTLYMFNRLPAALVSGNQEAVDFWADSGWPHDRFTFDGSNEPGPTTNRFDLVMSILAIFPSGANTDTYFREGFGSHGDPTGWDTNCYPCQDDPSFRRDGGGYHFFEFGAVALSAEMAYHNGMTQVYSGAPGQALLNGYKRGIKTKNEKDYRSSTETGHPDLWTYPFIWTAHRRFSNDSEVEAALPGLHDQEGNWLSIADGKLWPFLGFPPHAPGSASGTPPPIVSANPTCQAGQCPSAPPTSVITVVPSGQPNPTQPSPSTAGSPQPSQASPVASVNPPVNPENPAPTAVDNPAANPQPGDNGLQQIIDLINQIIELLKKLFGSLFGGGK